MIWTRRQSGIDSNEREWLCSRLASRLQSRRSTSNNICITKRSNGLSFVTWLATPLLICLEARGQLVTTIKDNPQPILKGYCKQKRPQTKTKWTPENRVSFPISSGQYLSAPPSTSIKLIQQKQSSFSFIKKNPKTKQNSVHCWLLALHLKLAMNIYSLSSGIDSETFDNAASRHCSHSRKHSTSRKRGKSM